MTKKFISLAMVIVSLDVYLRSQLYPNDPLFLFISNNLAVNIGLIMTSALVVMVSFKKNFRSWYSYAACVALAAVLCLAGGLSLFASGLSYTLSGIILPLDAMLALEAGVILASCVLSYEHAPRPAYIKPPVFSLSLPKFALPVPKIHHSPTGLTRTSVSGGTR